MTFMLVTYPDIYPEQRHTCQRYNIPRRRLDSLIVAVENRTACLLLLSDSVHTNC